MQSSIEENEQNYLTKASPKREKVYHKRALILAKSIKQNKNIPKQITNTVT